MESHVNDRSKKWFVFKLRKLIEKKKQVIDQDFEKSFQLSLMNKFWFNRFVYFFINAHAQIEKLIAKIKLITWNAWMEISLTMSFGVKCGVEVCSYSKNFKFTCCLGGFHLWTALNTHECPVFLLCLDCNISVIWTSVWLLFLFLHFHMFSFRYNKNNNFAI